ncbi:CDP-glycerol glycerophosphotransferase family protein [Streptomyces thinghirensis]|nr:CDP-glycerol glycerophosphotransferase family protein [Streptomyces thinghirensis]
MFDYAVLDRPIISYVPDWDVYSAVRGTYFDLLQEPPGAVATTQAELLRLLALGRVRQPGHDRATGTPSAGVSANSTTDAAERVVRRVFLGEESLPPIVPFDERPHAPTPAQSLELVERA